MTSKQRLAALALFPTLAFMCNASAATQAAIPASAATTAATHANATATSTAAAPAKPAMAVAAPAAAAMPVPVAVSAKAAAPAMAATTATLNSVIAGKWRDPKNAARDIYRHPIETLAFFGVGLDQTLIEITPGGGWYSELLAPLLNDRGHYIAAVAKPRNSDGETAQGKTALATKFAADSAHYGHAKTIEFDPKAPNFGATNSVDTVLTFRNVHNWVMDGAQAAMFRAFFDVLKPGGVLGVTDHRANPGPATDGKQGYLTEKQVIDYATAAGFVLDAKSEINANPKDTRDYPHGVWTLPPTLSQGNHGIGTYLAIGESDRMTLRFVKPKIEPKK
jgi:predicted methyltransferase